MIIGLKITHQQQGERWRRGDQVEAVSGGTERRVLFYLLKSAQMETIGFLQSVLAHGFYSSR